MKFLFTNFFLIVNFLTVISANAQVSQDLLDKAKSLGISDSEIQQGVSKLRGQSSNSLGADIDQEDVINSDILQDINSQTTGQQLKMTNAQWEYLLMLREDSIKRNIGNIVFGREIFFNKKLTFAPSLNIPTPKDYVLSAGDEVRITVWGNSQLNLKLQISPDGTVVIPNLGPVLLSGQTIDSAEKYLKQELGKIISDLADVSEAGNTFLSLSLSKVRSIKVNILGEANTPGTYTVPAYATLFNALYVAGGVSDIGSLRSIKVFRNSKEVANLDVYDFLLHGKTEANIRLEENDMIIIGPYESLVSAKGKVKRNRIFEMKKGETLKDLLDMVGGFTGDAYTQDVQIKRKFGRRYQIATVEKGDFSSFIMQDGDILSVDSVIPFYENRLVVTGSVWRPGEYELNEDLHTVKQLINQAGGLKGDEFTGRAQLTRLNPDFTTTILAVDVRGILNGTNEDIELQKEDNLHFPSIFDLREPYTIKVCGAVNLGDTVLPYHYNMTVEDAIVLAGGLKEAAATINVEVARRMKDTETTNNPTQIAKQFNFTLSEGLQVLSGDTVFTLEPFDEVFVRFSPGYETQQVVKVGGEIMFQGDYVLSKKNLRLSDLVAKAGGMKPGAYVKGASLKRTLTEDEKRRVETLLKMSQNKGSAEAMEGMNLNIQEYPVGIDLEKALANPGSADDVILRDGDKLFIPQQQSTVNISGAVMYENSITYNKGISVKEYILQAGGYQDIARKYPIVVYMNGKVQTTKRTFIFFKKYPKVEPGCEILVPAKTTRDRRMSLPEIIGIANSTTSMAAMITSIMNTLK
ncbi:SLBB domain-containing protein [Parabacteroides sp. APC149_11_2_Y6]